MGAARPHCRDGWVCEDAAAPEIHFDPTLTLVLTLNLSALNPFNLSLNASTSSTSSTSQPLNPSTPQRLSLAIVVPPFLKDSEELGAEILEAFSGVFFRGLFSGFGGASRVVASSVSKDV